RSSTLLGSSSACSRGAAASRWTTTSSAARCERPRSRQRCAKSSSSAQRRSSSSSSGPASSSASRRTYTQGPTARVRRGCSARVLAARRSASLLGSASVSGDGASASSLPASAWALTVPGSGPGSAAARMRPLARGVLWRFAPFYARRRAMRADVVARLGRLESELKRVRERHEEQIERLEDLARELVLTAESLRRSVLDVDTAMTDAARDAGRRIGLIATELNALPSLADRPFEPLDSPVGEVLGYRSAASLRAGGSGYVE